MPVSGFPRGHGRHGKERAQASQRDAAHEASFRRGPAAHAAALRRLPPPAGHRERVRGPPSCTLPAEMNRTALAVIAGALALPPAASAASTDCPGPTECCAATPAETLSFPAQVSLGVVLTGLYNVNEKTGTWDADYYLYESWKPQPGFSPQTEIVNEVTRQSEQFGTLARRGDRCIRSRRLRSTLSSPFDLRVFPFDRQRLVLRVSDSWFDNSLARYTPQPFVQGVDQAVYGQLSQWAVGRRLDYRLESRTFEWEANIWDRRAPVYDYATFAVQVRRHTTFHLTKFFLPLLVIVLVAMAVFWVDPADLASQVGIGVTCLLAAIAFQLAQASTLPEVAYLTLADLVYAVCYVVIALALAESLYTNVLARRDQRERALRVDRACRVAFPAGFAVLLALSAAVSFA